MVIEFRQPSLEGGTILTSYTYIENRVCSSAESIAFTPNSWSVFLILSSLHYFLIRLVCDNGCEGRRELLNNY
jgi:hypothetical protein